MNETSPTYPDFVGAHFIVALKRPPQQRATWNGRLILVACTSLAVPSDKKARTAARMLDCVDDAVITSWAVSSLARGVGGSGRAGSVSCSRRLFWLSVTAASAVTPVIVSTAHPAVRHQPSRHQRLPRARACGAGGAHLACAPMDARIGAVASPVPFQAQQAQQPTGTIDDGQPAPALPQ